ncbi:MAG: PrsW family glutamic-type intramembrane protease [Candidatus Bathyarchaeota archaeon]|nr:PrsW family glutamic-type intramembrane protease [Candidatus Bathyarchaeota archaeon]
MSESQSISITLHKPSYIEILSYFFQGLIISVPLTFFFETVAKDFVLQTFGGYYGVIVLTTIAAPLIEEFTKAFPLLHRHAETPRSIVTLGFFSGLGFGVAEFIVYVFFGAPLLVRFPELMFHAANTSIVAYGITRHHVLGFYALAVFLHFINNLFALTGDIWFIGGVAVIILTYILAWSYFKKAPDNFLNT